MIGLLDTSVMIDLLRQYTPADNWLQSQGTLGISRIVLLEVMEGAPSRQKQREASNLLKKFSLVELNNNDMIWATNQLIKFHPSHNVDAFDCLIASVAHRLNLPLYTRNLKHFVPLIGPLAQRPY
ncbi:MAG: hypothetical protein DPW16_09270 [Chloroflexi bacterium]|nr:hypothetical protein [Chloroflexota bacterium]